jgi:hypothetical protein
VIPVFQKVIGDFYAARSAETRTRQGSAYFVSESKSL